MKSIKKIAIIVIIVSSFALLPYTLLTYNPLLVSKVTANTNKLAPTFELNDAEGKTYSLSSFLGKKIVLHFWAGWCSACKSEMPELVQFYDQMRGDVVFLSINSDPDYPFENLVKENEIKYPILLDKNSKLANKYRVLTVPTTFIIDENGKITQIHYGPVTNETLNKLLE